MVVRFLTLLLAVILMTGVVASGSAQAAASGASGFVIDAPDAPDLDPAVVPVCTELAPAVIATRVITPPSPPEPTGRHHAVLVFRPPR